mgnify:FL=1|jgi:hypothetical protein
MDIVASTLQMYVDVYVQSDTQDRDTGIIKKEWLFIKTVPCSAKGVISNSISTRSSDRQVIDTRYQNEQFIQVRTSEKLNMRNKLTNVRTKKGTVIWSEINYPTETPTVFEIIGITPVTDPFGEIIAYNTMAKRSENQVIDN